MPALDLAQLIALAAALGFASGVRLYAVLLITGLAGYAGWVDLPNGLAALANPWVLGVAAVLFGVEFFADKIPFIDSAWDALHTLIRIPAGAALAASVFGIDHATWAAIAALGGGALAATSHFTKAGTRAVINTSPEPFSNIAASTVEDLTIGAMLWLVFANPLLALAMVLALLLLALWLLPKLFRFAVKVLRGVPTAVGARGG